MQLWIDSKKSIIIIIKLCMQVYNIDFLKTKLILSC